MRKKEEEGKAKRERRKENKLWSGKENNHGNFDAGVSSQRNYADCGHKDEVSEDGDN